MAANDLTSAEKAAIVAGLAALLGGAYLTKGKGAAGFRTRARGAFRRGAAKVRAYRIRRRSTRRGRSF